MFLTKSISQYINSEVSFKKFKLAKSLSFEISDMKLLNDPAQQLIKCYITDEEAIIGYDASNTISKLSCTCNNPEPDDCVHIVTALYLLLNTPDSKIKENKVQFEPERELEIKLERNDTNKYRELPKINTSTSNSIWNKLYIHKKDRFYNTYKISSVILNKESELEINVTKSNWGQSNNDDDAVEVKLKKENKHFHIKCNTCHHTSSMLCQHQHTALVDNNIHRLLANDKQLDYKVVSNYFMDKIKVSQKLFDIAYKVELKGHNYHAFEAEETLISTKELLRTQDQLSHNKLNPDQLHKLLEKRTTVSSDKWANAYLWDYNYHNHNLPGLNLLKGKALKSKNKLGSRITIESEPEFLTDKQLDFYKKLSVLYHKIEDNNSDDAQPFLDLLSNNIDALRDNIHYISTQEINDYQPLRKNNIQQIFFQSNQLSIKLKVVEDDGYYLMYSTLHLGTEEIQYDKNWNLWPIFGYNSDTNLAYLYDNVQVFYLSNFWNKKPIYIKEKDYLHLLNLISKIDSQIEIEYPDSIKNLTQELQGGDKHIYMNEAGSYIIFTPKINYNGQLYDIVGADEYVENNDPANKKLLYISQNDKDVFINYLIGMSKLLEDSYTETGQFYLSVKDFVKDAWFLNFYEACQAEGIEIFGQEKLNNFKFNSNKAKVSTTIASGIDWFEVDVDLSFGDEKVEYKKWIEAIKNNENYVKLGDGTMGLLPDEWFNKMKDLFRISDSTKDGLKVNHFKYSIVEELFDEVSEDKSYAELREKFERLKDANLNQEFALPKSITVILRAYQEEGFQWLCTLDQIGFGGCLADDMGLGKTIQMISLLAHQKELNNGTSIVIVPRSLLFNWIAEMDKFCPDLEYYLHHGPKRGTINNINQYDVILTTYDTATSDIKYLSNILFNYIILDESQAIKNPNSKRYKAMRILRSRNKFVMTGTPIENNTFDLYAQFSFINPGIFGGQSHFRDRFSTPIDKEGDVETSKQLKKIINPFLLRRTKELVAKDLPEKSENIIYCEMGPQQRKMYEDLKNKIANDIKTSINDNGLAKTKFKILDGLLRLRQICNSPLLLDKSLNPKHIESVKIKTLVNILEHELNDHSALVFSQFTSMLALIREELDRRNIDYAYLDGQTKDRKSAVEEFQNNDDIKLFLLSLKAGNTGLNLVKADYVYIVDPWWNPAVEAQAIDRTHRIGQDKNIFAYRMICKDSIEEKIIELQNKKKKIAKDIIVSDDNIFKSLEKRDLLGLFE
jgi:SNF2 family DNA or RNA helicase